MNLAIFLDRFDQFAELPDAVTKMREIVLSLAVQGRLSQRLPNDPPVSDLCRELQQARNKEARSEQRNQSGAIDDDFTERPFTTPDNWAWVPLNQIGKLSGGMTPSKNNSKYWDGE